MGRKKAPVGFDLVWRFEGVKGDEAVILEIICEISSISSSIIIFLACF